MIFTFLLQRARVGILVKSGSPYILHSPLQYILLLMHRLQLELMLAYINKEYQQFMNRFYFLHSFKGIMVSAEIIHMLTLAKSNSFMSHSTLYNGMAPFNQWRFPPSFLKMCSQILPSIAPVLIPKKEQVIRKD